MELCTYYMMIVVRLFRSKVKLLFQIPVLFRNCRCMTLYIIGFLFNAEKSQWINYPAPTGDMSVVRGAVWDPVTIRAYSHFTYLWNRDNPVSAVNGYGLDYENSIAGRDCRHHVQISSPAQFCVHWLPKLNSPWSFESSRPYACMVRACVLVCVCGGGGWLGTKTKSTVRL
jgi:hypothetical protein